MVAVRRFSTTSRLFVSARLRRRLPFRHRPDPYVSEGVSSSLEPQALKSLCSNPPCSYAPMPFPPLAGAHRHRTHRKQSTT